MSPTWRIEDDLDDVRSRASDDLAALNGKSLFVTGGTGFIGRWLLELLRHVAGHGIHVDVHVLTRDAARFAQKAPHLASFEGFHFHEGEVTQFELPKQEFDFIFHAATDASAKLNAENPDLMFDTALLGTRSVLRFAQQTGVQRMVLLSSGAVYGPQPWEVAAIAEDWTGGPDCTNPVNTYAEAKRGSEMLCAIAAKQRGLGVSIARIFAILGPMLELNAHFAAGNFLADAMAKRPVIVKGDGRAVRSYLYPTDLLVQLLAVLVRGEAGKAYNVGSDEAVSIAQLAKQIADIIADGSYEILGASDSGWNPGRYVPDITSVQDDFSLERRVPLDQAIRNTALSYGWQND